MSINSADLVSKDNDLVKTLNHLDLTAKSNSDIASNDNDLAKKLYLLDLTTTSDFSMATQDNDLTKKLNPNVNSASSASDTPDNKACLHHLPRELFDMVAVAIKPKDRINLRLVCSSKGTSERVISSFAEDFFTDHSVLLRNRESLETAGKIAAHPVFGRAIPNFTIFVDELCLRTEYCLPNLNFRLTDTSFADKHYRDTEKRANRAMKDRGSLLALGQGLELLIELFRSLETLGRIREIDIAAHVKSRNRKAHTLQRVHKMPEVLRQREKEVFGWIV